MRLGRYNKLVHWLKSPFGQILLEEEEEALNIIWQTVFGRYLALLGDVVQRNLVEESLVKYNIIVTLDSVPYNQEYLVNAAFEALPLAPDRIDAILLPHTLEFTDDAYQVLREVDMALRPDGHLIIIGFNPISLWGIRRLFSLSKKAPWCGSFRTPKRIKDWLRLLNFEVVQHQRLLHSPPIMQKKLFNKFRVVEKFCKRCLPVFGGAYILVARKKVLGVTPLRLKWKKIADVVHHGVAPVRRDITNEQAR